MKKIFISQPMKDKTEEEILAERNRAIDTAKTYFHEPVEVIDSYIKDVPQDAKPLWFIGKSLEFMSDADIAVFTPGWKKARGCKIEHSCAKEYGIMILELDLINALRYLPESKSVVGITDNRFVCLKDNVSEKEGKKFIQSLVTKPNDSSMIESKQDTQTNEALDSVPVSDADVSQDQENLKKIIPLIVQLQKQKSERYGRSYCKHGELSIFFNLERKWDRLSNMMDSILQSGGDIHSSGTPDETFTDTVIDLASYALLWAGYIAETRPDAMDEFIKAHNLTE